MVEPDGLLLLYAAVLALASALLAGLGPALKATRVELNPALRQAEHRASRANLRSALVIGQLAISILLLGVGFLFLRNLLQSTEMQPGFDLDHTLWAYVRLVPERYAAREKIRALIDRELEILRATPGVESASITRVAPLNDSSATNEPQPKPLNGRRAWVGSSDGDNVAGRGDSMVQVSVDEGEAVRKGALLARIESTALEDMRRSAPRPCGRLRARWQWPGAKRNGRRSSSPPARCPYGTWTSRKPTSQTPKRNSPTRAPVS